MDELFLKELEKLAGSGRIRCGEPMALHTTFRVGGPADYFLVPRDGEEIAALRGLCQEKGIPVTVIGNGSNLLVRDGGIRGLVLALCGGMDGIEVCGDEIRAGAGVLLSRLAGQAAAQGLSGLEFASGIPGTLGGGIFMNAGAYGGELRTSLKWVRVLMPGGGEEEIPAGQMEMSYRRSRVQRTGEIVLSACFMLTPDEAGAIQARMRELNTRRREKQPLEHGSAGSTFKRPEGYFAGKLIEECGLRGFSVGDAQVSEKHCGFVVNRGRATAAEVLAVIAAVQERVLAVRGVKLEPEVRILGDTLEPGGNR